MQIYLVYFPGLAENIDIRMAHLAFEICPGRDRLMLWACLIVPDRWMNIRSRESVA